MSINCFLYKNLLESLYIPAGRGGHALRQYRDWLSLQFSEPLHPKPQLPSWENLISTAVWL